VKENRCRPLLFQPEKFDTGRHPVIAARAPMNDLYRSYADLAAYETEGRDYRICTVDRHTDAVIAAPHGGRIEPSTSRIATAIASGDFSLYLFEGLQEGRPHRDLHITSERFDEPQAMRMIERCALVVTVHGRRQDDDVNSVWLGGLDAKLREVTARMLAPAGFTAKISGHRLPGDHPDNLCNRGNSKAGLQLEMPRALRDTLADDEKALARFATAIRHAILWRLENP
jgi:phage replication-related protein YjqB (UPF0714/DUF867 family)